MNPRSWALVAIGWIAACGGRSTSDGDAALASGGRIFGGSGGSRSSGGLLTSGGSGATSISSGGLDDGAAGGSSPVSGGSDSGGVSSVGGGPPGGSGGSVDPPPRSCDSSDGSGCEANELCLDNPDLCFPEDDTECEGVCAKKREPSSCDGGLSNCSDPVTCPALPGQCPDGQVNSVVDGCWGPCVPADCCACQSESDCYREEVSCDREAGRCVSLEAPEPRCRQPFDPGNCDDEWSGYAFVEGSCQERMASTCGSAPTGNLFFTLEECLMRCEGLPAEGTCPEGRVGKRTCLECGAGGGCGKYALVCTQTCNYDSDCADYFSCLDGVCGASGCF